MYKFKDEQFERISRIESKDFEREKMKELYSFIKKYAENLRMEELPIQDDGRIKESGFNEIYAEKEIEEDAKKVEHLKSRFGIQENKKEANGEKLEILKTAIFNKFLGEDFIVVRSSEFDDFCRHIDNVIVEKKTGNIVSAFDEVSETHGPIYDKKVREVSEKNESGASLKYGFSLDKENKIKPSKEINNIPLFYLALSQELLEKGIKNFESDSISIFEKKIFEYFIRSIDEQMKEPTLFKNISESDRKDKINQLKNSFENIRETLNATNKKD